MLSLSYIRDVSVEKNPIYQADVDFTVSEGRISLKYIFTDMIYIPIIAGVLLIGLIVLLVLLIRRKKRAAAAAADSAEPSAEHESGDAAPHDEVHLNAVTGLKVDLAIVDKRNVERQVTAYISGSYIVGRGRGVCELSIEDDQLSRQHFALIYENETLKIQDLQSTNGTLVNGIRLEKPRALKSGDVIEAGNSRIIVLY